MDILGKLERRFGQFAIPNLTVVLCCLQVAGFVVAIAKPESLELMTLSMAQVAEGQVWRLATFLCLPSTVHPIFFFFAIYLFYLMGATLEANWGEFRYNVYVAIVTVATLAVACVFPEHPVTNVFIGGSIFLAFAHLYPNFTIVLFFLLPVRIRWLALLTWIFYFVELVWGDWATRAFIAASVSNFLLFFGKGVFRKAIDHKRHMDWEAKRLRRPDKPFHCCAICGATERSHPKMDFRYCTKCAGSYEYCADHLGTHEHVGLGEAPAAQPAGSEHADGGLA